jgi:hypothetical protein
MYMAWQRKSQKEDKKGKNRKFSRGRRPSMRFSAEQKRGNERFAR